MDSIVEIFIKVIPEFLKGGFPPPLEPLGDGASNSVDISIFATPSIGVALLILGFSVAFFLLLLWEGEVL